MKTIILYVALLALVFAGCTGKKFKIPEADVPAQVTSSFQQKYPGAQVVEWEAEKEGSKLVYEVGFTMDNAKKEAAFKPDGEFIKEE